VSLLDGAVDPSETVAVLGLSYKPATEVVEESQGIHIAKALVLAGHKVVVHDPLALDPGPDAKVRAELGDSVIYIKNLEDAVANASAVIVANGDPAFKALTPALFDGRSSPVFVLDCWRYLRDSLASSPNVRYRAIGVASE